MAAPARRGENGPPMSGCERFRESMVQSEGRDARRNESDAQQAERGARLRESAARLKEHAARLRGAAACAEGRLTGRHAGNTVMLYMNTPLCLRPEGRKKRL